MKQEAPECPILMQKDFEKRLEGSPSDQVYLAVDIENSEWTQSKPLLTLDPPLQRFPPAKFH